MVGTMPERDTQGLCELSYTPDYGPDGEVEVSKAIEICHQFQHSLQFWGHTIRSGMLTQPEEFIQPVPHLSFVYGQEQVDFLRSSSPSNESAPFL